jgi:hypothetical protein
VWITLLVSSLQESANAFDAANYERSRNQHARISFFCTPDSTKIQPIPDSVSILRREIYSASFGCVKKASISMGGGSQYT